MKVVFTLSLLFVCSFSFGQELKTSEKRVEIDLKDGRYDETVYTIGQNGVVVKSFSKDGGLRSNYYLHHDVYNADLELYETDPIDFESTHPIVATFEGEESIYHIAYKRNLPIYIYQFDVKNKITKRLDIDFDGKTNFLRIHSFYVVGNKAAAIGQGKNGASFILIDLQTQTATANENDKVKGTYSNISFWYDKYFLSYGVQCIKNKVDDDVKRKRTVLFLNKVSFE